MIRVFEAFAGIGGFRSGLERVGGFKIVGWCEIDKFAQKAYRILFDTGKEEFYEDITKIDYRTMPDFDLLVGGPPCQSWSYAGLRKGFEDDRGNMFLEYIRILEAKNPSILWLRMLTDCLVIRRGEATESSLKRFANWGIACAGVCLTAQISELPKTGKECILWDILEKEAPSKYWLSEKAAMKIAQNAENKQS